MPTPAPAPETVDNRSPTQVLSELVIDELIAEKLLPSSKKAEANERLCSGSISVEDWKLYVEMALDNKDEVTQDADAHS